MIEEGQAGQGQLEARPALYSSFRNREEFDRALASDEPPHE